MYKLYKMFNSKAKQLARDEEKEAGGALTGEPICSVNTIRSQGYTRPLSVFKIRSVIRSKYAKTSKQRMNEYFFQTICFIPGYHLVNATGQLTGKVKNHAVSVGLLQEILLWLAQDIDWSDIISRLRPRTVPSGYTFCLWKSGKFTHAFSTYIIPKS